MKRRLLKIASAGVLAVSVFCSCSGKKFDRDTEISVLSREDGSGTRGAFIELFGIEKKDSNGKKIDRTTDEAAITNSTAVMLASVSSDKCSGCICCKSTLLKSINRMNDMIEDCRIEKA